MALWTRSGRLPAQAAAPAAETPPGGGTDGGAAGGTACGTERGKGSGGEAAGRPAPVGSLEGPREGRPNSGPAAETAAHRSSGSQDESRGGGQDGDRQSVTRDPRQDGDRDSDQGTPRDGGSDGGTHGTGTGTGSTPERRPRHEVGAHAGTDGGTDGRADAENGRADAETHGGTDRGTDAGTDGGTHGAPEGRPRPDGEGDRAAVAEPGGWRSRLPVAARVLRHGATALAAAVVAAALLLPSKLGHLTAPVFLRIPVEGIFGVAVLLLLGPGGPGRLRRAIPALAGVGLGLMAVLKLLDLGFDGVYKRPFDLVLDWVLLDYGQSFLKDSVGSAGAIGVVVGALLLVVLVLCLTTWAAVRLNRVLARHSAAAVGGTLVLGTVWVVCAALGVRNTAVPVAADSSAEFLQDRVQQVRAGLRDKEEFARVAADDDFADLPADRLLTGLRGKDVIFAFIESYGRSALEDPEIAPSVSALLADTDRRLRGAGWSSRSGFLTSPTYGGGSWLAHSTFNSGLWIKNQQRYRTLTSGDRMTLTEAFRKTGAWRTVGIMPGVTRSWPEGKFYGLDHVYDSRSMGYKGPKFSWTPVPDQYSLSAFERLEHGKPGRGPMMAEIMLASSHNPWAPLPRTLGWDEIGDGSVYDSVKEEGEDPGEVWKDPSRVRTEYGRAIEYSLTSLLSYVEEYGGENTVLVFLGDHQPVSTVTGDRLGRDVPATILARDPAVLDRIAGWGWQPGLKPGPDAPVWPMDAFRDRFLSAYGDRSAAATVAPAGG
ncbi:sulfatase [Streptomyces pacificus]|uniref:Sulfatase n=1 Tax=Streptomyces pacificus TaxID=2705029 RepID=A0A6A0AVJ7_9ACTN|nr:sulfatase [Streptomyces pacificus]GFH36393.1 sulfatase [Streptomyces pacificus]